MQSAPHDKSAQPTLCWVSESSYSASSEYNWGLFFETPGPFTVKEYNQQADHCSIEYKPEDLWRSLTISYFVGLGLTWRMGFLHIRR